MLTLLLDSCTEEVYPVVWTEELGGRQQAFLLTLDMAANHFSKRAPSGCLMQVSKNWRVVSGPSCCTLCVDEWSSAQSIADWECECVANPEEIDEELSSVMCCFKDLQNACNPSIKVEAKELSSTKRKPQRSNASSSSSTAFVTFG